MEQEFENPKIDAQEKIVWEQIPGAELFVGLVGAMGTDIERTKALLTEAFKRVNYTVVEIRLSELLTALPGYEDLKNPSKPWEKYYHEAIDAGNAVRARFDTPDALAQIAIIEITKERKKRSLEQGTSDERFAYVFHSLKLGEEIALLRQVYGDLFYCIAVYADAEARIEKLQKKICAFHGQPEMKEARAQAQRLLWRDEHEDNKKGQDVRGAFVHADYFIRSDDEVILKSSLERFVSLIFDEPYISPTRSEISMMHARTAALRSVDLSRQVGAVIASKDGRILTTGCNEVPKAGGGQYEQGDLDDARDFQLGYDTNDRKKRESIIELLAKITSYLNVPEIHCGSLESFYEELSEKEIFKDTRIDSLIEFGRVVHAEMAAITSASMDTITIRDADLYCTTFPCHMCTRLIINAGIRNVFYIEPYPKSATHELYRDSVSINPQLSGTEYHKRLNEPCICEEKVYFLPFEGVAPRRYHDLFSNPKRKEKNGDRKRFNSRSSKLRQSPLVQTHGQMEELIAEKMGNAISLWVNTHQKKGQA